MAFAAAAAVLGIGRLSTVDPGPQLSRFSLLAPPGQIIQFAQSEMNISPNGRAVAFFAADSTGTFRLWVNEDTETRSFVPSLDVADIEAAKRRLEAAGCTILRSGSTDLYFEDPFGFIVDVIQKAT